MRNWWKRSYFNITWDNCWYEDWSPSYICFMISCWKYETHVLHYSESNDTNRWKVLGIDIFISKLCITIHIPYWKLPDHKRVKK